VNSSIMALIPARGGSKGLVGKNMRPVAGKPLIYHTFKAAKDSGVFDRIIVSTDDGNIARFARKSGVEVPFMRPKNIAGDKSPMIDSVRHALRWMEEKEEFVPSYVMLLQPTSPLRSAIDIRNVVAMLRKKKVTAVVSVTPVKHHPYWTKRIGSSGRMENFIKSKKSGARRQDLPAVFALNGALYLVKTSVLLKTGSWMPRGAVAYVMPPERSVDIDSEWDLMVADLFMRRIKRKNKRR